MVHRIYSAEVQLNKANASDAEEAFLDLKLSSNDGTVSTKIYNERDDLDKVKSHSLMAMSLGVPLMVFKYFNLFASLEHLPMLVTLIVVTNCLTANLPKQGNRYHKLRKAVSNSFPKGSHSAT